MYIRPEDVESPKQRWSLIAVLDEGKEGTTALALGRWKSKDGETNRPVLAMRWNGRTDNPVGTPHSRGLATWFIVEEKWYEAFLQSGKLHPDKITLARSFFPLPSVG